MSKSAEKFLRTKKLSLSEKDNGSVYKTQALRSHRRPVPEPAIRSRPVDQPGHRALFPDDSSSAH